MILFKCFDGQRCLIFGYWNPLYACDNQHVSAFFPPPSLCLLSSFTYILTSSFRLITYPSLLIAAPTMESTITLRHLLWVPGLMNSYELLSPE